MSQPELAVRVAQSFGERLIGLLGKQPLQQGEALLIKPCRDIHTFGMRYTIDAVFVDEALRILKVVRVPKNRMAICRQASAVFELAEGESSRLGLVSGLPITACCDIKGI